MLQNTEERLLPKKRQRVSKNRDKRQTQITATQPFNRDDGATGEQSGSGSSRHRNDLRQTAMVQPSKEESIANEELGHEDSPYYKELRSFWPKDKRPEGMREASQRRLQVSSKPRKPSGEVRATSSSFMDPIQER